MFNALPTETDALRHLLGELYDDLPGRLSRLRLLTALDDDFGGNGVMLPGGDAAFLAYTEARSLFVIGNFLAAVLMTQAAIENILASHLILIGRDLPKRAKFEDTLRAWKSLGIISDDDERKYTQAHRGQKSTNPSSSL